MQLSEGLISVFVPFLADLYWASKKKRGLATAMLQTIRSSHWTRWVWFARILFWKAEKGTPDAVGGFLGTDHVMSVYHTPWTRLFPLKPFDTSDVPPRLQGRAETMASSLLCLMSSSSSSAHTGGLAVIIPATRFVLFLSRRSCMILLSPPHPHPLWKRLKNLVHEFAEHRTEVWPPRCNTNIETVRNGPKFSCMFRKTFRQLVESYRCH